MHNATEQIGINQQWVVVRRSTPEEIVAAIQQASRFGGHDTVEWNNTACKQWIGDAIQLARAFSAWEGAAVEIMPRPKGHFAGICAGHIT